MTYRCARCEFRSDNPDYTDQHTLTHPRCTVCRRSLPRDRTQTCQACVTKARGWLNDIEYAAIRLVLDLGESGYHTSQLPGGNALIMLGTTWDAVDGGGPDDWPSDPAPVLAVLEAIERDWRHTLHQPPAEHVATITGCLTYLNSHLDRAAEHAPQFGDSASELRDLRQRVTHIAGIADDPVVAEATCFDCAGLLIRPYRPPVLPRPLLTRRRGIEQEGVTDVWECRRCHREYLPAEYMLAVRAVLEAEATRQADEREDAAS